MKVLIKADNLIINGRLEKGLASCNYSDNGIKFAAEVIPFKFDLSQMIDINASDEFGEVRARSQHVDGENQYLIHYKSATGCVSTLWFAESMLTALECNEHPGCPVYGAMPLPVGVKHPA